MEFYNNDNECLTIEKNDKIFNDNDGDFMLGFDTMINGIPEDIILYRDKRKFEVSDKTFNRCWLDSSPKPLELKREYLTRIPGLEKLQFDEVEEKVLMRYSAKVLKSSYLENINKDNYQVLFDVLAENEIVEVDKTKVLSRVEVYWADVVSNLRFPDGADNHLAALKATTARNNLYIKERDNGIEIHSKSASDDFYLKFYIKLMEVMARKRANSEILKYVTCEELENIIRVELSLKKFASIRSYLDLPEDSTIRLKDILFSKANPLYRAFHKALNVDFSHISSYDPIYDSPFSKRDQDVLKYVGMLYSLGGNVKLCRKIIRERYGANYSPEYKKLNLASEYLSKVKLGSGMKYIKEISDKLKAV